MHSNMPLLCSFCILWHCPLMITNAGLKVARGLCLLDNNLCRLWLSSSISSLLLFKVHCAYAAIVNGGAINFKIKNYACTEARTHAGLKKKAFQLQNTKIHSSHTIAFLAEKRHHANFHYVENRLILYIVQISVMSFFCKNYDPAQLKRLLFETGMCSNALAHMYILAPVHA